MARPDADRLRQTLSELAKGRLERLETFAEIESTNTYLKEQPPPAPGHIHVAIADHQTAGRGRGQRQWVSAPGESLCLSMSYTFERPPTMLPAVTLALGVGIARALETIGVEGIGLKWPNDLLIGDAKLGGILTETRLRDGDDVCVVAGVGMNLGDPAAFARDVRSEWAQAATGLTRALAEPRSREELAGLLIDAMLDAFSRYDEHGFAPFCAGFESLDWLNGKSVRIAGAEGSFGGVARGIDETGALLIESDGAELKILSGTILVAEDNEA